ncbi:MAG TPA: glycosyltransferase family 2 protein [Verrucomicrobiae bacterium]|nr:glycosyltransferase family 2 protein [Verrucomicrobiae bacterium]
MNVSIIICTRNRADSLRQTLQNFRVVLPLEHGTAEVIIADNGSTDGTQEVAQRAEIPGFEVRYVFEPNRGQVNARHAGMAVASGQIIVFTDDDVRPSPGWLRSLVEPIAADRADATVGTVRIAPHLLRSWMTSTHRGMLTSTENLNRQEPEAMVGANMAFSRNVLTRVPGFDPELGPGRLGFWDDSLFSFQVKRAGFRLRMAVEAEMEHHFLPDRLSRAALLDRAKGEGESEAYVAWHWKHQSIESPTYHAGRAALRLFMKRVLAAGKNIQSEGLELWELNLIRRIAYLRHLNHERRRTPNYQPYGLVKISAPPQGGRISSQDALSAAASTTN